jgi:hypothetical protein
MKDKKPVIDNPVLIALEAIGDLPLPDAIRALKCSMEVLRAAQIAARTSEAIERLVPLKDLEDTPGFDQVLTALLDAEPDCHAAAGIADAALKVKLKQIEPQTKWIQ